MLSAVRILAYPVLVVSHNSCNRQVCAERLNMDDDLKRLLPPTRANPTTRSYCVAQNLIRITQRTGLICRFRNRHQNAAVCTARGID